MAKSIREIVVSKMRDYQNNICPICHKSDYCSGRNCNNHTIKNKCVYQKLTVLDHNHNHKNGKCEGCPKCWRGLTHDYCNCKTLPVLEDLYKRNLFDDTRLVPYINRGSGYDDVDEKWRSFMKKLGQDLHNHKLSKKTIKVANRPNKTKTFDIVKALNSFPNGEARTGELVKKFKVSHQTVKNHGIKQIKLKTIKRIGKTSSSKWKLK